MMPSPRASDADAAVYALVLNWNGWSVTLRCLESLLRTPSTHRLRVVVWDNGSGDGSVEHITAWAAGREPAGTDVPTPLMPFVAPPLRKPLACRVLQADEKPATDEPLIVIRGERNLGYAGGNNAALRWALAQADCAAVWILNNDVVVDPDSLSALLRLHAQDPFDRPIGTPIYDYDRPDQVQAWAGQRLGRGWLVAPRHARQGERIDYLIGASIFLSRARLLQLGFFNEDYFLNAEDLEFTYGYARQFRQQHAGQQPFLIGGRIWHQESATQGRSQERQAYYFTRNLIYAAWRIGRRFGITTFVYGVMRIGWNLLRGRTAVARGTGRGLLHALRGIKGPLPA